jgi:hypothetical protein
MIGSQHGPVTVERVVPKRRGVSSSGSENAITLRKMLDDKNATRRLVPAVSAIQLMNVFDHPDPQHGSHAAERLFTKDWTLILIDHTRAFETI